MKVDGRDLAEYALRLGDDALVLSQRLCAWITHTHSIEEDLAFSNISLDLLGHARTLLTFSGKFDGTERDEDDFAFNRNECDFRNALLFEQENGDFATTIARQLAYSLYISLVYMELTKTVNPSLSAFAVKAVNDVQYHRMHAIQWTIRLGRGTDISSDRMQNGLNVIWPYTAELFASDNLVDRLATARHGVDPALLRTKWEQEIVQVITDANLTLPTASWQAKGGRDGNHTESFGLLISELQSVHRQYPGGAW
ncbi:1,2-phenylacetyl-CoA epoxidase subunit PaaC [Rhodococcus sp. BH5]|uniref:1,2-phenylacetyl-CoA epoxidase subunit PaaC n=1 Tax=Rhodococcus sp. BH5 TaxID=2871702 RepID=UPI0022CD8494|nr:1,2-phenylacetyl-CoA epoxidase subunit PaaC [Rhodococcus sp. BH5]MCZ9634923.1 phenylacetate-CoA oxygenase subunit PaaC [Rhodococcus sp. BH5]